MIIPFNSPSVVGTEVRYIESAIKSGKLCSENNFIHRCQHWIEQRFQSKKVFLTPSCTASLEMAALLIDIKPGDEVIMPSYTFVSTANAFVLRGAKIVFIDIDPNTMNINSNLIEKSITNKTKAIVPVHYAGIACKMDIIMKIAKKYHLYVIEDSAHGVMATYKGRALGTIGDIGCFSFHETKNYTSGGEGGAILINNCSLIERAETIRDNGTNRKQFSLRQVNNYTWQGVGSNYLMSNLQAAYLWAQLKAADIINQKRLILWKTYFNLLKFLECSGNIELPSIPSNCKTNAHIFYIKLHNIDERQKLIKQLKKEGILSATHYIPLHSSQAGRKFGKFFGKDLYTTKESSRLLRLPLFYNLEMKNQYKIINTLLNYFK